MGSLDQGKETKMFFINKNVFVMDNYSSALSEEMTMELIEKHIKRISRKFVLLNFSVERANLHSLLLFEL